MTATRQEIQQEALGRAVGNQSLSNWPTIFAGFVAKGIPESDIRPRENVFTYHAWRALGRQVRRGEHGVKVTTFVNCKGKEGQDGAANESNGTDKTQHKSGFRHPSESRDVQRQQRNQLICDRLSTEHAIFGGVLSGLPPIKRY